MLRSLSVLLGSGLFLFGGCVASNPVFMEQRFPILSRPTLRLESMTRTDLEGCSDQAISNLRERDKDMKEHILKLEVAIDQYNEFAKKENEQGAR